MENVNSTRTNCEKINKDEEEPQKKYFVGNTEAIVYRRANNQDLLKEQRYLILKYARLKDIAEIRSVLEYMYCCYFTQKDFLKWCYDLFNEEYELEEQVDKFINMYKENYSTGFEAYIR